MSSPPRTQSLPIIRIVSTRTMDEDCFNTMGEVDEVKLPSRFQAESQEEDELLRLRLQLQAESAASRGNDSTKSLQHTMTCECPDSRVSAQQALIGLATVPDTATHFGNERVLRRFPTAPQRSKPSIQPLKLQMNDEDEEAFVDLKTNGTSQSSSSQSLFCGIPSSCDPSPPNNSNFRTPGIEMQGSFRTLFEPINDKARKFFGSTVRSPEDDGTSSAVTEPFDNRSLQRNGTWASALSVQDYFGSWTSGKDKRDNTPTSVTQVPGQSAVSLMASKDEEWDTNQIADRLEQSLNLTTIYEQDQNEDGVSSEDACYGEASTPQMIFDHTESLAPQHESAHIMPNISRTKFATNEIPVVVKTKNLRPSSPVPKDSFWEDLLAEGIVEREDFSACSSGFGIEIVNAED